MTIAEIPTEITEADKHSGHMTLRGSVARNSDLAVGRHVCIDRANSASVYTVTKIQPLAHEDGDDGDDGNPATRLYVEGVHIDGDYAVLPGDEAIDIADRIIRLLSRAELKRRKSPYRRVQYTDHHICVLLIDPDGDIATLVDSLDNPLQNWLWHASKHAERLATQYAMTGSLE